MTQWGKPSDMGHIQITGPGNVNRNTRDEKNPNQRLTVSGRGAGKICATMWFKNSGAGWYQAGKACLNVH